jgi:hypothetical protein
MFARQQLETAAEERCFLYGPCRDVISRAVSEVKSVEVSQSELLGFSRELLLLEAGNLGRGQFGNPEEGERPPLEAATSNG